MEKLIINLHPTHVDQYITEEMSHNAMLGPFKSPPIDLHTSPFLTREKVNSDKRRVIVDLSWPFGNSVNNGSRRSCYKNVEFVFAHYWVRAVVRAVKDLEKIRLLVR